MSQDSSHADDDETTREGEERFVALWTDYLEGELDEAGHAELRALLARDERLVQLAVDLYQTHRLLGVALDEDGARRDAFVRETLARLPAGKERFVGEVMRRVGRGTSKAGASAWFVCSGRFLRNRAGWIVAAAAIVALLVVWPRTPEMAPLATSDRPASHTADESQGAVPESPVRFESLAHAEFFGQLAPPVNSAVASGRDYVLTHGLVELSFPGGACAIVEAPAVFRILSESTLGLDLGSCSVHAPHGGDGFAVVTPFTRVVDRGTRFTVCVDKVSSTEVHVVEGIADVYQRPARFISPLNPPQPGGPNAAGEQTFEIRLTETEARRFPNTGTRRIQPVAFMSSVYRRRLPDRIVSYEATSAAGGGAKKLLSVTAQRGGRMIEYSADELIPVSVTWFKSEDVRDPSGHLVGGPTLPERRVSLLSDRLLNSGVINPGGSAEPLASDPIMKSPAKPGAANTPGLAVRFDRPVINGPGPDVVFMELQTVSNPPEGDAFHVSPLDFRDGRHAHTIDLYDLTMTSSEALPLPGFHLYAFEGPVPSLPALENLDCLGGALLALQFRALAVGIDLSELGFDPGEAAEGLFIQDAEDNGDRVDPTFIGGFPTAADRL